MRAKRWNEIIAQRTPEQQVRIYQCLRRWTDKELQFDAEQFAWYKRMEAKLAKAPKKSRKNSTRNSIITWKTKYGGAI